MWSGGRIPRHRRLKSGACECGVEGVCVGGGGFIRGTGVFEVGEVEKSRLLGIVGRGGMGGNVAFGGVMLESGWWVGG